MKSKLRLGIVGTGVAARQLYLPALRRPESRVELVACCNRSRRKAVAYARLANVPRVVDSAEELFLLPEVDAVLLSLPIDSLPRYVLRCLAAGKPVLSEKPVAPSVREGRRLLRAAARHEPPWVVAENFEFMSHASKLKRWIEGGELGRVRLVEVTQITRMDSRNPYFASDWRQKPRFVGAFVVDGGVHLAHVVRATFGYPTEIRSLTAGLDRHLPPPDTAVAALRFPGGALGTWRSCFSADYDGPLLRIFGEKANAELHYSRATLTTRQGKQKTYEPPVDSFTLQFAHFAAVVLDGETPRVSPAEALEDLRLVEALVTRRRFKAAG
jgi:predicted dehydrogenase